ncbi:MAG: glycosyltransferase family 39 protein [Candidatus Rokubacteria bacterium]|nr:glycosyltransferase family 39 protein [Candidatus Rokubacteria bacterium]
MTARREWALVLGAFAALVAVYSIWLALDRRPPEWDHANHLERAMLCGRDLGEGDVEELLERSSFYPPLVLCLAGALYRVLPTDAAFGQIVIWLFLGLGMAATYLLGRRVGGGTVGVLAAVLFGTAPFVIFSSLRFQLDLPLAAMVALALWTLLNTEGFTRRAWCAATGVAIGLGMLTKPPFAVYVLPAVALALGGVRRAGAAVNLALTALVAAAVSLPWYGPRIFGLPAQIGARSFKQAAEIGQPDALSVASVTIYPRWFMTQFGILAVALLFAGLVLAVRERRWTLVASVLVPFAIFGIVVQNKNLRYTLPILPVAAVAAALAVAALRGRARQVAVVAIGVLAIVQLSGTAFGVPRIRSLPGLGVPWVLYGAPMRVDWRHRDVLAMLARDSAGAPATVSVVTNFEFFSVSNFRYYALRDGSPLRWVRAWDDSPLGVHYMITKTGDQGPSWTAEKPRRIAEKLATDAHLAGAFPVLGEFPLPDGSVATVRVRRVPPHPASPGAIAEAVEAAVRREVPAFARDVDGLAIQLDWDGDIARGRIRRLVLTARSATVGELRRKNVSTMRAGDVRIVARDLVVNPASAVAAGRLDVLEIGGIAIEQATITAGDLATFLAGQRRFSRATLRLEDGAASFALEQPGPDVSARVRILPAADRPFALEAEQVRVAGIAVPSALVNWVIRHYDPTARMAKRIRVPVEIRPVEIAADAIRIGGDGARR